MQEAQGFCSLPQQSNKSASIRAGHRYRSPRIPCFCPTVAGRRKPQLCPPAWLKKLSADSSIAGPEVYASASEGHDTTAPAYRCVNEEAWLRAGPASRADLAALRAISRE